MPSKPIKGKQAKAALRQPRRKGSPPKLDISILLDRTGSMAPMGKWVETISAVNVYAQKLLNDDSIDARVMVTCFDRYQGVKIDIIRKWSTDDVWKDLTTEEVYPRGDTPLYDAMGKTLTELMAEKRDEATRVQYVVMTDGQENASHEWKKEKIVDLVEQANKKPNWLVVFLGADLDAMALGASVGTQFGSTMSYSSANVGQTMASLASNTARFTASGKASDADWSNLQRQAAVKPKAKL